MAMGQVRVVGGARGVRVTTIHRQLDSVPMWASVLGSGSSDPHGQCAGASGETEAKSHIAGRVG